MKEMKDMVECLHHIGFPTKDVEATVRFYSDFGGKVVFAKEDVDAGKPIQVRLIDFHGTLIECYERSEIPACVGAIDHLAFKTNDIEAMYAICKEKGYRFMEDCAKQIGLSTYWPNNARWFIVYGPNEEKIEFCTEDI